MITRSFHRLPAFFFAVAFTLGIGGCRDSLQKPVDDASIAADVRNELSKNTELATYPITVDVVGGQVTLAGRVDRPGLRQEAEMAAKRVEGVESVSNRILVASAESTPSDSSSPPTSNE